MTLLRRLNFWLLQWMFVRVIAVTLGGELVGFQIWGWITPLSGYGVPYDFLGGRRKVLFSYSFRQKK